MEKGLTIVRQENVGAIAKAAPERYEDNRLSNERCLAFGRELLREVDAQGMTDELDRKAAAYIEKSRKTLKAMNERRSPVTKLFDEFRRAFTSLENEVDPSRPGTVPYELQQRRNRHAARKLAEQEERLREEEARRKAEEARERLRLDMEEDFRRQFQAMLDAAVKEITECGNAVTLDNYALTEQRLRGFGRELPEGWAECARSLVSVPAWIGADEFAAMQSAVLEPLLPQFAGQYAAEVPDTLDFFLDRLPGMKKHLEEIAAAGAEKAAVMKADMEARRDEEAARMEDGRREREAGRQAEADMRKHAAEMRGLFGEQAFAQERRPKAKVSKRIEILNPEGILPVLTMWWQRQGRELPVDELCRLFRRQVSFCERLADAEGVFIEDESVAYADEVKAR